MCAAAVEVKTFRYVHTVLQIQGEIERERETPTQEREGDEKL